MLHKGVICGILAAVCYGTNPFGALPLYEEGVNTSSVLFYRFSMAVVMLGVMLLVAGIMAVFFKERITFSTVTAILLALGGIGLLYQGDGETSLSTMGIILVILSALCYAIYIVVVNQSSIRMSSLKLTFYVLFICMFVLLAYSFTSSDLHLQLPPSPRAWFYACWLGLVPTILSLVLMTIAVHEVGATPTAIMGALEPLTAVAIGVLVFGEALTVQLVIGIVLILSAVLLIVLGKNFHLRTITHTISTIVRKTWRWK